MLRDRDYMRSPSGSSGRSLTVTLIVVLIALFVVQSCLMLYGNLPLLDWFALSLDGFKHGRIWQLFSFQFMHSTPWPWHVLFNCLGLYFFGRSVEEALGKKRFLLLYFASGLSGGVLQLLTTWLLPHHPDFPVLGASAGVMGLIATYATLFPMREITIFVFVFPITLRAQYIFWLTLGLSIFGTIIPFDGIAHPAHLGGLLMGMAYLRWEAGALEKLSSWNLFRFRQRKQSRINVSSVKPFRPSRTPSGESPDLPPKEFISQEVDPILDKISAHGIQSLTERERQILEAARARMSKR